MRIKKPPDSKSHEIKFESPIDSNTFEYYVTHDIPIVPPSSQWSVFDVVKEKMRMKFPIKPSLFLFGVCQNHQSAIHLHMTN